jgi:TonB family protein
MIIFSTYHYKFALILKLMKNIFLIVAVFLISPKLLSQTPDSEILEVPKIEILVEEVEEPVYVIVPIMPEFIGGNKAMYKFIGKNLKYPAEEKKKGVKGRVIVNFIVEKDGTFSNVKILRGVSENLDNEAIRIVKMMPPFNPGLLRDQPVRVVLNLPINFY